MPGSFLAFATICAEQVSTKQMRFTHHLYQASLRMLVPVCLCACVSVCMCEGVPVCAHLHEGIRDVIVVQQLVSEGLEVVLLKKFLHPLL